MKLARSPLQMQTICQRLKREGKRIGFVPTMGALHEGHLSLVRRAKKAADYVVLSIFVNPTQFGPKEDFHRYPRDVKADIRLLAREGVDLVFAPAVEEIYPLEFDVYVAPGKIAEVLEGKSRPGHFQGVATVVLKLFNIVLPDVAVFGQKDLQQSIVIRKMVRDFNIPVKIVVAPTVRDSDGLALSSRNRYLNAEGRRKALVISQSLLAAKRLVGEGERSAAKIRNLIHRQLVTKAGAKVDYVSVAECESLQELKELRGEVAVSLACCIEGVRLIDNIVLKVK